MSTPAGAARLRNPRDFGARRGSGSRGTLGRGSGIRGTLGRGSGIRGTSGRVSGIRGTLGRVSGSRGTLGRGPGNRWTSKRATAKRDARNTGNLRGGGLRSVFASLVLLASALRAPTLDAYLGGTASEVQPCVAENTTAVVPKFSDEKWAQAAVLDSLNELNHTIHTPPATAHAVKLYEAAVAAEPALTELVKRVAHKTGAELAGLDFRLKSVDSLARKIDQEASAEYNGDIAQAAHGISDANRYTIIANKTAYVDTLLAAVDAFERDGWVLRIKNFWEEGDPYDGVNIKAVRGDIKVELQVHTPGSFDVKENKLHALYEVYRTSKNDTVRQQYWGEMTELSKLVDRPDKKVLGIGTLSKQKYQVSP